MLLTNIGTEVSRALLGAKVVVGRFFTPAKDLGINDLDRGNGTKEDIPCYFSVGLDGKNK